MTGKGLPKRGIPPFHKGREEGVRIRRLYNYGLISNAAEWVNSNLKLIGLHIPLQKGEDKIKIVPDKIWRRKRY
jgi:hypothetical protein